MWVGHYQSDWIDEILCKTLSTMLLGLEDLQTLDL